MNKKFDDALDTFMQQLENEVFGPEAAGAAEGEKAEEVATAEEVQEEAPELAYASVPRVLKAEPEKREPPIEKTPLAKKKEVNPQEVRDFLKRELPWGQSGKEFVETIKALSEGEDLAFIQIYYDGKFEWDERPSPDLLKRILAEASLAGLLISGESRGYEYGRRLSSEALTEVYRVNEAPGVDEFLSEPEVEINNIVCAQLIQATPFFQEEYVNALRPDVTGIEFFSFFKDAARTLEQTYEHEGFLVEPEAKAEAWDIKSVLAKIESGEEYGLLASKITPVQGKPVKYYYLTQAGIDLLEDIIKEQTQPDEHKRCA